MGKALATETTAPASARSSGQLARDVVELAKPRITVLELTMLLGGVALAPSHPSWSTVLGAVLGTALIVAAANALNMALERDTDRLMARTAARPVASKRMGRTTALVFSVSWFLLAVVSLAALANLVTACLGVVGFVLYGFVYTPLKRRSTWALLVGAVPGAMPALMGWTAVTGTIGTVGLVYAGILFVWQLPHFLAISVFRRDEYARAGLAVVPNTRGTRVARFQALLYTVALLGMSLLLVPVGAAGLLYASVALVMGGWLFVLTLKPCEEAPVAWGRRVFFGSLVYLPVLALGLVIDVVLPWA